MTEQAQTDKVREQAEAEVNAKTEKLREITTQAAGEEALARVTENNTETEGINFLMRDLWEK